MGVKSCNFGWTLGKYTLCELGDLKGARKSWPKKYICAWLTYDTLQDLPRYPTIFFSFLFDLRLRHQHRANQWKRGELWSPRRCPKYKNALLIFIAIGWGTRVRNCAFCFLGPKRIRFLAELSVQKKWRSPSASCILHGAYFPFDLPLNLQNGFEKWIPNTFRWVGILKRPKPRKTRPLKLLLFIDCARYVCYRRKVKKPWRLRLRFITKAAADF